MRLISRQMKTEFVGLTLSCDGVDLLPVLALPRYFHCRLSYLFTPPYPLPQDEMMTAPGKNGDVYYWQHVMVTRRPVIALRLSKGFTDYCPITQGEQVGGQA